MAYDPTIPQAAQKIANTQASIQENFRKIDEAFKVDHADFNVALADFGKHTALRMVNQAVAPAFDPDERGFYNFTFPTTATQEVYAHVSRGAGTAEVPMTASILSTTPNPANMSKGWSYLPSGLLIKWNGHQIIPGAVEVTITPNSSDYGPVQFTKIFHIQVSPYTPAEDSNRFIVMVTSQPSFAGADNGKFTIRAVNVGTTNYAGATIFMIGM